MLRRPELTQSAGVSAFLTCVWRAGLYRWLGFSFAAVYLGLVQGGLLEEQLLAGFACVIAMIRSGLPYAPNALPNTLRFVCHDVSTSVCLWYCNVWDSVPLVSSEEPCVAMQMRLHSFFCRLYLSAQPSRLSVRGYWRYVPAVSSWLRALLSRSCRRRCCSTAALYNSQCVALLANSSSILSTVVVAARLCVYG